jgi:hypothetical protein
LAPFSPITPNLIEKDVHDLMQVDSSTASLQKTACLTKPKGRSVRWLRYLKMLVWGGVSMVFSSPGKEHLKAENARKASIFLVVELPRRVTRRPDAEGCRLWEAILSLSNMPGQRKWDMKSTHSIIHDQQLGYSGDL